DMDGIYTVTLEVEENTTVQYRFINGNDWPMSETVPMTCGVDDGFGSYNRSFTVTDMDASTVVVCFGECEDCDVIVEPIMVNVTFVVNMENETISANGVHLAGNFQGWDPAATEMTDPGMLAIYSVTVPIEANTVIEYKFVNGNAWGSEEAVPGACATNNNRTASIGNTDMSIDMVCFGECANCGIIVDPVMVNITFQVNMQNETVDANGVHIAGSMQGWDPATTMMTDVDMDGIYTVTLEVEENTTVQYRFINGNDWPMSETVPTACGADDGFGGYNRSFTVTDMDASTVVVCFGECEDCDVIVEPTMVNVTFMVNMQNETVSANGVHVAGNFQGWDPATTIMDDGDADGIFTVTVEIESNTALEYKFVNGNAWGSDESVPAECATNNNRTATVADINLTLDVVCYAGCMDCDDIVEPTTVTVLFQVDMSNEIVSANGVHVAGSFQGWNPNGTVMTDLGGGIYELSYEVEINTTIQFKFINGSDWPQAETVPAECGEDDGFGGINRSLSVGEENIAFGPVCFAACTVCDDVVEPATVEVTFMVDMSNETVSADGVHIAGNFQGWIPATSQMTDDDSDNIYEFTAEVDTNSTVLFKFINGNDWPMQETVPAECGEGDGFGGFNRILEVGEADADYGPVCFASCAECAAAVPVLITFRVDMSNEAVSADGVFIAGDFNGWDATATQMSEYATNLYEAVVVLNSGETVQYKFVNGLTYETVPAECGVGDFLNRSYTASSINETLTPVCFAQCSSCTVIPMVDITFQLDLGTLIADASGVHVAGSFNGWSPSATQMTLAFDNLYTATVTVAENTQVLFKYLNGNDWPMSEVVPFECGVDDGNGGYNRSITVDDVNITLPEVCLGSCVDCPIGVDENELNTFNIFPIPANTSITISAAQTMDETLSIVDATGRAVQTIVMNNVQTMQVNVEALSAGLYQITNNLGQLLGRMVVE
ncbi:MAG: T9SS type A sorting domain-containing protein, partial [Flavobacteriales bacterium]